MKTFGLFVLTVVSIAAIAAAQTKAPKNNMNNKPYRIYNPDTLAKPTVGYSQVAEVTGGKIVYIAGQVALDKSGNLVGKDDFRAQTQQVFENLKAAVEAASGDASNIIKLNIYVAEGVDAAQVPV